METETGGLQGGTSGLQGWLFSFAGRKPGGVDQI